MTFGARPDSPYGDGLYGLQAHHGVDVIQGSHHCAKMGCTKPAQVAVFGTLRDSTQTIRANVCREHVEDFIVSDLGDDAWFCALLAEHSDGHDYCPHCATRRFGPEGQGHLRRCPVGLAFPRFAEVARLPRVEHKVDECEPCSSYLERRAGPTG